MAAPDDEKVRPSAIATFRQLSTFEKEAGGLGVPSSPAPSNSANAESNEELSTTVDRSGPGKRTENAATQTKIKRANRRGLCGRFTVLAEIEDPYTYSRRVKWFITFVVAVAAAAAPTGSAILYPALDKVADDLNSTATITNMSIALYMLSMSFFPLWWSAFSEHLGRRTIYLVSFSVYLLFGILSAVSNSIGMFIAMRMLSGGASASVQAVGAGTIADIWEVRERGRAMGFFYLGPLCGPLFAPIIGGILSQELGWRSTMWLLVIYGGITLTLIFFALPETKSRKDVELTSAPQVPRSEEAAENGLVRVSSKRSIQQRTVKWMKLAKTILIDPLKTLLYLRFPAVLLTVYYASITFGALYVLNISIQDTFHKDPYKFSDLVVGLLYIPASIGYFGASIVGGRWMDYIMRREAEQRRKAEEPENGDPNRKLIYRPEDRMRENAWLGSIVYPCALIWYGWTAENGVFWVVPMIASFFFGCGSMLIFAMATTMLTEFMPRKSSSGVAVNNFVRNIFSCVGGIVAAPIIAAIGNGWVFTILGIWSLSSCVVIWAMRHYGPRWRKTMDAKLK